MAARLPLDEEDEEDRDSVLSAGSVETGGLRSSAGSVETGGLRSASSVETGGSRPASRQNSASSMNGLRSVAASSVGGRRRSPNLSREPSGRYRANQCCVDPGSGRIRHFRPDPDKLIQDPGGSGPEMNLNKTILTN